MKLVIADTGPINYLLLTGYIDVLPRLFGRVVLPPPWRTNLINNPETPKVARKWITHLPPWLEVQHATGLHAVSGLGAGETEAITLAIVLHADLLLMDDRRGVRAARGKGIEVTGTLGVLALANRRGLTDLAEAFDRIKQTNFRYPQEVMDRFLAEPPVDCQPYFFAAGA